MFIYILNIRKFLIIFNFINIQNIHMLKFHILLNIHILNLKRNKNLNKNCNSF